jgi:hypothetical protein
MDLTRTQALFELQNNPNAYRTVDSLRQLAGRVSGVARDFSNNPVTSGVALFYSGSAEGLGRADGIKTGELAYEVSKQYQFGSGPRATGSVYTIGATDVAKFISHPAFEVALERASNLLADSPEFGLLMFGEKTPSGARIEGFWDIASRNMAASVAGDVKTFTAWADKASVFTQTELKALLLRGGQHG